MKYIETLEELKKYKGKFVYFYYTNNGQKNGKILFAWAKKITNVIPNYVISNYKDPLPLKYHEVYGTDTIYLVNNQPYNDIITPRYAVKRETQSNAQQFARELTVNEQLICRMLTKKQEAIEKGLIKIKTTR